MRLAIVCPLLSSVPSAIYEEIATTKNVLLKIFLLQKESFERPLFQLSGSEGFIVESVRSFRGRVKKVTGSQWKTKGDRIISPNLGRRIAEWKADVAFCTSVSELLSVRLFAPHLRCSIGAIISDTNVTNHIYSPFQRKLRAFAYRQTDVAVAYGQASMEFLKSIGYPEHKIIHGMWSVPNRHFSTARSKIDDSQQDVSRWISVGRLEPRKGFAELVRAWSKQNPDFLQRNELVIVGDGVERGTIEALIDNLGMRRRIRLIGEKSYDEIPAVYASSDVFVFPTLTDMWGLVVNEAMAASLPILCSEFAGCHSDLVRPENGRLCDPRNPDALGQAIGDFWHEREKWPEMGKASLRIVSRFTPAATAAAIVAAARMALNQRNS